MKPRWMSALFFGAGTFFIIMGTADSFGLVDVTQNATAFIMVGVGFYMLGAAYLRSQSRKLRRKP